MKARDVMTAQVVTVSPDNGVRQAAKLMLAHGISGLPVIDNDGRLAGLISEGDLLRRSELGFGSFAMTEELSLTTDERARAHTKANAWRVADVMSRNVIAVAEDTPLSEVAALMQEHGVKRLPVVREGALVGIVSRGDLLHVVVGAKSDQTASGDDAIRRSIITRLNENPGLEVKDVTVTVDDGIVHLWGDVASEDCRVAARVVAEGVRGVKAVIEHFPYRDPSKSS